MPTNTTGDMQPRRVQRRRTKGWRTPALTRYVGRGTRWGNPHPVDEPCLALRLTKDKAASAAGPRDGSCAAVRDGLALTGEVRRG